MLHLDPERRPFKTEKPDETSAPVVKKFAMPERLPYDVSTGSFSIVAEDAELAELMDRMLEERAQPETSPLGRSLREHGPGGAAESGPSRRRIDDDAFRPPGGKLLLLFLSRPAPRMARELDPLTKDPVGAEREVFSTATRRLWLNFPRGNGAIAVAADKILFEASTMTGNIYLAKPKTR